MALLFKEEYYDAVRPYMPEDARRILDNQLPVIKKDIEAQVDKFAKDLGEEVKRQVDEFQKGLEKEHQDFLAKLTDISSKAAKSGASAQEIADAGNELQRAVDEYKKQVQGWGETARKAMLTAAKGAGIPIPI